MKCPPSSDKGVSPTCPWLWTPRSLLMKPRWLRFIKLHWSLGMVDLFLVLTEMQKKKGWIFTSYLLKYQCNILRYSYIFLLISFTEMCWGLESPQTKSKRNAQLFELHVNQAFFLFKIGWINMWVEDSTGSGITVPSIRPVLFTTYILMDYCHYYLNLNIEIYH